ncbi:hypothetical protein [Methanosphaera sp. WGK6]|uniref:hypothetical protein n=1 Tax=Methanosphaera sp. WGK6 TaxID=1561964 RepID=UPI00084CC0AA|nr:hypothetical protein [Methanosphaera sp. WGK6]OED30832.1 hypothetical protein NL43_00520 [Methanosphaera sp. WGK6]
MSNYDDLRNLSDEEIIEIGKYSLVFLGGVVVGYGIKKIISSPTMSNIKRNTGNLIKNYFDPTFNIVEDNNNEVDTEYVEYDVDE